ncbi:MAG: transposase [Desulfobacteraceae bacterium]|jgi:putative transposase|nr:transposase [Desulfobacteraceae bacterium]
MMGFALLYPSYDYDGVIGTVFIAMTNYRRHRVLGGTYFFTVAIAHRRLDLLVRHIDVLKEALRREMLRAPFEILAFVVLPVHLHAVWRLPEGDADYSGRWRHIKAGFSLAIPKGEPVSESRKSKGERGIWQRRFWEHTIRDDEDLRRHLDYVHFNPVKHGHVRRVADWPHSTFHRFVLKGKYSQDWGAGGQVEPDGVFGE